MSDGHGDAIVAGVYRHVESCPFCGPGRVDVAYLGDGTVYLFCANPECHASGPRVTELHLTEEEQKAAAIERWNKRI